MPHASSTARMEEQEILPPITALVRTVISALVSQTEVVKVDCTAEDDLVRIHVTVAPEDLNRVIGPQGRTICSIRTVLQATFAKLHRRHELIVQQQIATTLSHSLPQTL